jgi:hypothetical protein
MSENVVAEPLSGSEIIEAVCFKLKEQLARDCFLSPNSAYEYFSAKIEVKITAVDCGRVANAGATVRHTVGDADAVVLGGNDGYDVTSTEDIPRMAPNVLRRETEQPVPVTVADTSGKTERKNVKYQRQEKPAAASKGVKTPVDLSKVETPTT